MAETATSEELVCEECGQGFVYAAAYTKHTLKCKGKPATSGRIAARDGAVVPLGRPRVPAPDEKTDRRRSQYRGSKQRSRAVVVHVDRTPPEASVAAIAGAATSKAIEIVIAGLLSKRDAIDRAISALRAVST